MADYKELRIGIRADGSKFDSDVNSLYTKLKNGLNKPINPQMMESAFSKIPEKLASAFKQINLNQFFQNFLAGFKNIFSSFGNIFSGMFNNSQVKSSISAMSLFIANSLSSTLSKVFSGVFSEIYSKFQNKQIGFLAAAQLTRELKRENINSRHFMKTHSIVPENADYENARNSIKQNISSLKEYKKEHPLGYLWGNLTVRPLSERLGNVGGGIGKALDFITAPVRWSSKLGSKIGGTVAETMGMPPALISIVSKLGALGGPVLLVGGAFTAVYKAAQFVARDLDGAAKASRSLATSTAMFMNSTFGSKLNGLSSERFFSGIGKLLMSFSNPDMATTYNKVGLSKAELQNSDSIVAMVKLLEAFQKLPPSKSLDYAKKIFGDDAGIAIANMSYTIDMFVEDLNTSADKINYLARYSGDAENLTDNISRLIQGVKLNVQTIFIPALVSMNKAFEIFNQLVNPNDGSKQFKTAEELAASGRTADVLGKTRYMDQGVISTSVGKNEWYKKIPYIGNGLAAVNGFINRESGALIHTTGRLLSNIPGIAGVAGVAVKSVGNYFYGHGGGFDRDRFKNQKLKEYAETEKELNQYFIDQDKFMKDNSKLFQVFDKTNTQGAINAAKAITPDMISNARKTIEADKKRVMKLKIDAESKEKLLRELESKDADILKIGEIKALGKYEGNQELQTFRLDQIKGKEPNKDDYIYNTDFFKKIMEKDLDNSRKQFNDMNHKIWESVDAGVLTGDEGKQFSAKLVNKMASVDIKNANKELRRQFFAFDDFMNTLKFWMDKGVNIPNLEELKNNKLRETFGGLFEELAVLSGDIFVPMQNKNIELNKNLEEVRKLSEKYPELISGMNLDFEKMRENMLYGQFSFLKPSQYDKANELKSLNQLANTGTISESEYNIGKKNLLSDLLTSQYTDSSYISGMKDLEYLRKDGKISDTDYNKEKSFRNNNLMGEMFGGEGFSIAKEIKSKLKDLDYMFNGNIPENLKNQVMYGDIYKSGDESMKQIGQNYKDLMSEGYSDGSGFTDMGQVGTSMSRYGAKMDIELKNLAEQQLDVLRGIYGQIAQRNYNMRLA